MPIQILKGLLTWRWSEPGSGKPPHVYQLEMGACALPPAQRPLFRSEIPAPGRTDGPEGMVLPLHY